MRDAASDKGRHVRLASESDQAGFRAAARRLLTEGVSPERVHWWVADAAEGDLFEGPDEGRTASEPGQTARVPAFFVPLCEQAALHSDPGRFGLLYRLLWRLVHEPALRGDPLDEDRLAIEAMAREVRRDMHKMTAFVRFRTLAGEGGGAFDASAAAATVADESDFLELPATSAPADAPPSDEVLSGPWHVAWFEPDHHIVEATAPFFARRFAQMRWAILTPERCVRWDGHTLEFGPGARRDQAPAADAGEQLWLTYYEHIFNPARLKVNMMVKEMPRRYWPNLPEARLIQPLIASASAQQGRMIEEGGTEPARRRPAASAALRLEPVTASAEAPTSLVALREATQHCRECPIGAAATQSVPGEGRAGAALMLVGEQPGDQEDLRGQPFVGPAGQLLSKALRQLGWPRDQLFVTNAVKHFKYELRGARRIHKTPAQREAAACLHWLESEIELVGPQALVALGATAARSLMGRAVAVMSERGRWLDRADGRKVLITLHPSALLRMDPAQREAAYEAWVQDLALAGSFVGTAAGAGREGKCRADRRRAVSVRPTCDDG